MALSSSDSTLATWHAGVTDHLAESEPHAISIARNILGNLNMAAAGNNTVSSAPPQLSTAMAHSGHLLQSAAWEEPLFPAEQLRGERLPCLLLPHHSTPRAVGLLLCSLSMHTR